MDNTSPAHSLPETQLKSQWRKEREERIASLLNCYFSQVYERVGLHWEPDNKAEMEYLAQLICQES
jgi:hypothetical protein